MAKRSMMYDKFSAGLLATSERALYSYCKSYIEAYEVFDNDYDGTLALTDEAAYTKYLNMLYDSEDGIEAALSAISWLCGDKHTNEDDEHKNTGECKCCHCDCDNEEQDDNEDNDDGLTTITVSKGDKLVTINTCLDFDEIMANIVDAAKDKAVKKVKE